MNAPEAATQTPPAGAAAVASLAVGDIVASPSNPRKRFDDAYIAELADSIKSHGLIQPITVRPLSLDGLLAYNKRRKEGDDSAPCYELVVGECRWRAARLAGLPDIPAFLRELDDKQVLEIQVIENLQRRDVHPIEEAEGYQALIKRHGYTADQIALRIGKSRSYVFGRMKLAALCSEAREAAFAGKLDTSTAQLIARIPGAALQQKAAKEIISGYNGEPLSYRAAQIHIRTRYTLNLLGATFRADDALLLPAAGACSACPKRSGSDPDLFGDIDSANICTDPDCHEAKRLARRDQLIAFAEKRKIPVITDPDLARPYFLGNDYVMLDDTCEDDADERTYREILGDKAPVAALVQRVYGNKDMLEFAAAGSIEKALKKAGWTPAAMPPQAAPGATPEQIKAAEAAQAKRKTDAEERDRREASAAKENTWRDKLAAELLRRVELDTDSGALNTDRAIVLLAQAWLQQSEIDYNFPEELMTRYGVELPAEYDSDAEMARIFAAMDRWSVGRALAFLFDALTEPTERGVHLHNVDDIGPPRILLAAAAMVGLDADALREPRKVQPKTAKTKAAKKPSAEGPGGMMPVAAWPFPTP